LLAVGIHGCERGVPVIKASEKTKPVSTISELTLGERIKAIRKALGLSQAGFAEEIGSHVQTVSRYERDEMKPSVDTLSSIVTVFFVDADWLLTGRKK
jgi:DNA-binding transcriptional regulator YiaG